MQEVEMIRKIDRVTLKHALGYPIKGLADLQYLTGVHPKLHRCSNMHIALGGMRLDVCLRDDLRVRHNSRGRCGYANGKSWKEIMNSRHLFKIVAAPSFE